MSPETLDFLDKLLRFCFSISSWDCKEACRYDHQERLTAMEAMEHAYFHPVVRDHGRHSNISSGSPTGAGAGGSLSGGVPASPILSPINTPMPPNSQAQ